MTEVLSAAGNGSPHFAPNPLQRSSSRTLLSLNSSSPYLSSSTSRYTLSEYADDEPVSATASAPSSPQLEQPTFSRSTSSTSSTSTPASSLFLDSRTDLVEAEDQDIQFPSFEAAKHDQDRRLPEEQLASACGDQDSTVQPEELHRSRSSQWPQTVHDDQAVEDEPTRHVDYLCHSWREEDIWSSWRYVVARRKAYSNSVRLENASWRTWTKVRCNLQTISPETLNWLKDCDVTWLYGPLHTNSRKFFNPAICPPPSRLSTSSSFIDKKPILKKKTVFQSILQRSISSHSLLQQAGAMLQAQQAGSRKGRPSYERASSEISMGTFSDNSVNSTPAAGDAVTPGSARNSYPSSGFESPSERRHIHFNNEVAQFIAVDSKDEGGEASPHRFSLEDDEDDEDDEDEDALDDEDEGVVMMKPVFLKARVSNRSTPRNSFGGESKTIKPLPSTTLKYRGDTPELNEAQQLRGRNLFWPSQPTLSPSASQETLRPSRHQANFLLDDDEEDVDVQWRPSGYSDQSLSTLNGPRSQQLGQHQEHELDPGPGMRRTPSGMFMPYDEDEEEMALNNGLFGRVVDTVNTAKDIAHVIWNVGWRQ